MRLTSVAKRCKAVKGDGRRCEAHALTGSPWCFFHDPGKGAERQAARGRGGVERSTNVFLFLRTHQIGP